MNPELKDALIHKLLALADDELILAHRNSEWTGHAPILEEDIAFSNIAQDELGHAIIWYSLLCDLTGEDADELVFFRQAADFRNAQIVELPKGDWAFTMLRQYLFDAAEMVLLTRLLSSHYQPLAEAAAKMRNEEIYHYRHTTTWIKRLGLGTEESHRRTQVALDQLWPLAGQLFQPLPDESLLVEADFVPDPDGLHQAWLEVVQPFLVAAHLLAPPNSVPAVSGRDQHTDHLTTLLAEMQAVARFDPQAEW
jgi:ring-1,2-phenylacetyl-CoA epoxidase subunit PaaC